MTDEYLGDKIEQPKVYADERELSKRLTDREKLLIILWMFNTLIIGIFIGFMIEYLWMWLAIHCTI